MVHLLYAPPLQRGRCLVIEELVPILNIPVRLCVPQQVKRAYLVPGGRAVEVEERGGSIQVVVPEVLCHQAISFEY